MKNIDTRVQYTKQKLRTAIMELLQGKSIDKITVKEICEKAGLNRGTFYLHYNCPAALLKDIENQFIEESERLFDSFWRENRQQNIMAALFAHIKRNSDIFCVLMGPHGNPYFVSDFFDSMRDGVLEQWHLEFPEYSRDDLDFIFEYVLIGSTRLILNWLHDSRGIPSSDFAKRIERMGHHALMAIKEF